jgi:hypothetical protein
MGPIEVYWNFDGTYFASIFMVEEEAGNLALQL